MYDELVKRLRELQVITEHCGEQSCDECENRELCDKNDNKTLSGTYKEAADAIENTSKAYNMMAEAYEAEVTRQRWIPVTERLPEDGVYVLGRYKNDEMAVVSVFDHDEDFTFWRAQTDEGWEADCDTEPTHWMPLPQPPMEGT